MFTVEELTNGVRVEFNDCTNRYYGDYHRVNIEVLLRFAADSYTTPYKFQTLGRMGVSSADVGIVQAQLIASFRQDTMRYMAGEQFPTKFIRSFKQRKNVLLPGLK